MFGIDWPELMVVGLVALIVIGPEDLPEMFRQLGRFTAKLRQMSREFSRAMEQAAKDTGVKDVHADLKGMTSAKSLGIDAVKNAADSFEKWDPLKNAAKPTMSTGSAMPARSLVPPAMPATPVPAGPVPATLVPAVPVGSSLTSAAERDAMVNAEANAEANADARLDDMAEAEDDLAYHAEDAPGPAPAHVPAPAPAPAVENTIHGPATQALYDKQALRAQVLAEQTEKLKAIEAGTYVVPAAELVAVPVVPEVVVDATPLVATTDFTPLPAARKRAGKAKSEPVAEDPAKAPRKTKKKADVA